MHLQHKHQCIFQKEKQKYQRNYDMLYMIIITHNGIFLIYIWIKKTNHIASTEVCNFGLGRVPERRTIISYIHDSKL